MQKVYIASILLQLRDIDAAVDICNDLEQYMFKNQSAGYYFPNAVMPFRGMMSSEIKAHSLLLMLYKELSELYNSETQNSGLTNSDAKRYAEYAKGIQQWLLLQKRNQMWENNTATSDAIFALIQTGAQLPEYELKLNKSIRKEISNEFNTSSRFIDIPVDILTKKGELAKISLKNNSFMIANLYYQYLDDVESVKASGTGMNIERKIYRKEIENSRIKLNEIREGEILRTGDEIVVRYQIKNDENRSFVHLKSMRAACLMPVTETSGYIWTGGAGAYREIKESVTNYYFQLLPEGSHTFEENFFVTQEGVFSSGSAQIQSIYAPEYRAKTAANEKFTIGDGGK